MHPCGFSIDFSPNTDWHHMTVQFGGQVLLVVFVRKWSIYISNHNLHTERQKNTWSCSPGGRGVWGFGGGGVFGAGGVFGWGDVLGGGGVFGAGGVLGAGGGVVLGGDAVGGFDPTGRFVWKSIRVPLPPKKWRWYIMNWCGDDDRDIWQKQKKQYLTHVWKLKGTDVGCGRKIQKGKVSRIYKIRAVKYSRQISLAQAIFNGQMLDAVPHCK